MRCSLLESLRSITHLELLLIAVQPCGIYAIFDSVRGRPRIS